MGGFTSIHLKNTEEENIILFNCLLKQYGIKDKKFYSRRDELEEYYHFKINNGNYPSHLFPREKIHCLSDFQKYWNRKNCGTFVPLYGELQFDCYFGRTSISEMNRIAKFLLGECLLDHVQHVDYATGSYETFVLDKITLNKKEKERLLRVHIR